MKLSLPKLIVLSFGLLITVSLYGQKKQVCLTYDDLPLVTYGVEDTVYQKSIMQKLVESLQRYHIPATGFVIGQKLGGEDYQNSFQVRLLKTWTNAGLSLGNHTYSHPDYNTTSFKDYTDDILYIESIYRKWVSREPLEYFRHPMLHSGKTKEKADSLSTFLEQNHLRVAPVTIDNDDYLFALAYKRAWSRNDTVLMNRIQQDFISYIEAKLLYYEKQSQALFARPVNQILLLHASALNAASVDALANMFNKHGYQFISLKKALKDPVYRTPITTFGKWGISWIDRWALSLGKKGDFFKDEPKTPDYIIEQSK